MKPIKLLLVLPLLLLFTSCFQKKAYTIPLCEGEFISLEEFTLDQKEYTGVQLIATEITLKEFNKANQLNVLQDYSLKVGERKYYIFQFYLLNDQEKLPISMYFEKKCNPHAMGPDRYILRMEIPDDKENIVCDADLRIDSHMDPTSYHLVLSNRDLNLYLNITLESSLA